MSYHVKSWKKIQGRFLLPDLEDVSLHSPMVNTTDLLLYFEIVILLVDEENVWDVHIRVPIVVKKESFKVLQ